MVKSNKEIRVSELCDETASLYRNPADWHKLCEQFGIGDKENTPVKGLSGGERQRLFIVLALIPQPDLVFLDELTTGLDATTYLQENGVLFMPGKAANAGGVATSALEMSQNSMRLSWTAEEVDAKLHGIMVDIFHKADDAAKRYGMKDNYVAGANIAGFEKVVDAMKAQGIC